jgi:hypothetical protein
LIENFFLLTNFSNDKQTQKNLENDFSKSEFQKPNIPKNKTRPNTKKALKQFPLKLESTVQTSAFSETKPNKHQKKTFFSLFSYRHRSPNSTQF